MLKETTETELDEFEIQDVRCSVNKTPIPTIPHWYAKVKVNFVSAEAARSKQAPAPVIAPMDEPDEEEDAEEQTEIISLQDVDENVTGDDFDHGAVDINDTDD